MSKLLPILVGSAALAYASNVYAADPQKVREVRDYIKTNGVAEVVDRYPHYRLSLKGSQIGYPDQNADILLIADRVPDGNTPERGLYIIIAPRNIQYQKLEGLSPRQKEIHLQDGRVLWGLSNTPTNSDPDGIVDAAVDNGGIFDLSDSSTFQTAQSEFDKVVEGAHKTLVEKK